jgi:pSer/pThr/pTyr-binding forkhead associated (FHA) protein
MSGARVILRVPGLPGQTTEWTIGSDPGQDVVILADGVSRQHAAIVHEDGRRWKVVDRLSRNGTFVNNKRIDSRVLAQGNELRLGTVTCVFELFDRSGRRWGETISAGPARRSRPLIDMVLLLVGSLVVGAVLFFVYSLLRR